MSHIDDSTGQKTLIGKGYAGHGTGLNNPEMQAEAFYGAGEYIDSLGPGGVSLGARAGVHAVAGATAGGINAAIGGGDIGLGALVGGMSGGTGTYAGVGGYLPGDFASQLASRALIGGAIGGASAELYGGDFAQGFGEGAMTAASALLFNEMIHGGNNKGQGSNEKNAVKTALNVLHVVEGSGFALTAVGLWAGATMLVGPIGFVCVIPAVAAYGWAGYLEVTHGWSDLTGK
jgi:hypothetical protein